MYILITLPTMMHKKNTKKMRYNVLYLIIVAAIFFSCSDHNKIINQHVQSSKAFDSVAYKTELSGTKLRVYISFLKHGKRYEKFRQFVKTGDFYSEQYAIKYYIKEDIDTILIPTFVCKDTSFKKIFNYDNPSIMAPQGFYDWSYNIKRQPDGLFLLAKQNLTDTTWKEFFWYDKDFVIDRMHFINSGDTLILGK